MKYKCYYLFTIGCIEGFPYDINSVWYFTLKKCLNNKWEYPKYMHGLVVKICSCRFVNWKYRLEHAWWCYLSLFWLLNWHIHFRLTVVGDWQFKKVYWEMLNSGKCVCLFFQFNQLHIFMSRSQTYLEIFISDGFELSGNWCIYISKVSCKQMYPHHA